MNDANTAQSNPNDASRASFWDAFRSTRLLVMVGLGYAAGLPNPLTGRTLSAWLETEGVNLATIGLFALVQLPYNFKFLWAPLLDRFALPLLGKRRGWMLISQLCLLLAIPTFGFLDPARAPWAIATLALFTTFLAASQDIAIDGYRVDLLPAKERASGSAIYVAAYRVAMIASSAGALILSEFLAWSTVYMILASTLLIGIVTTIMSPEPEDVPQGPKSIRDAFIIPLREFWGRKHAIGLLLIVMLYKVGDAVAGQMMIPFLLRLGFGRAEIGAISKGLGLSMSIAGTLLAGGLVAKWGLRRALIVFGVLQAIANLLYAYLAHVGANHAVLVMAIGTDNLMNGMGTAAFVALLMTLCNRNFSAAQFALLSSLASVPGRILSSLSGIIAEATDWPTFFLITTLAGLPAILLIRLIPIAEPTSDPT